MGLLKFIFGRPDYRQPILDSTVALANEAERIYRNQLENIPPSNDGLLKVRLFSCAFGIAVFAAGECDKGEEDAIRFLYECIDIAMRPFSQPRITLETRRQPHIVAAGKFITEVVKLIDSEMTSGPSRLENTTLAFQELVEVYRHCLKESAGDLHYERHIRYNPNICAASVVWTHLRFVEDSVKAVRK